MRHGNRFTSTFRPIDDSMVRLCWMDWMGKAGTDEDSTPLDVILIPGQCLAIIMMAVHLTPGS